MERARKLIIGATSAVQTQTRALGTTSSRRAEAGKRLRRAVQDVRMAEEGCDSHWVKASAEVAYLELSPTERPARGDFNLAAARNAHACLHAAVRNASATLDGVPGAPLDAVRDARSAVLDARMTLLRMEGDIERMQENIGKIICD